MDIGVSGISSLIQSIPGAKRSGISSLAMTGGFGPDFIIELGKETFGGVAGYTSLATLNQGFSSVLQAAAAQATQPQAVFSQQQADEINETATRAALAISRGDYETATQEAQSLLQDDPNSSVGYHLLGRVASVQGNYEEAITHYQRASDLSPDNARFQDDLFNAQVLRKSDEEVLATAQELVRDRDTALNGIRLLFEFAKRQPANPSSVYQGIAKGFETLDVPAQQLNALESAVSGASDAELVQLETEVTGFIEANDPSGRAYALLGQVQQRLGKFEDSIASFERAKTVVVDNVPDDALLSDVMTTLNSYEANVYATIGNQALGQDNLLKAESYFLKAKDLDPLSTDIQLGLATIKVERAYQQLDLSNEIKARSYLTEAESLLDGDEALNEAMAQAYLVLGDRARREGMTSLGILNYEDAYALNPETAGLKRKLADAHYDAGQNTVDTVGYASMSEGEMKNVIDHFQDSYDLFGSNETYKTSLANALNEYGLRLLATNSSSSNAKDRYKEAMDTFSRARTLYPDNTTYQDNWNQAYTKYNSV